jgi:hypothetical protein
VKFSKELDCAFGVIGKILMIRFNGIYLVRFEFRIWDILIFKKFLLMKFQINSKQPSLEGKIN